MTDTPTEVQVVDEEWVWRKQGFLALGFAEYEADLLASRRLSPHDADELLGRGCPLSLALKILL